MWPSVNFAEVIQRLLVEVPLAISTFLHLQHGGAIADFFPVSHIVGRIGWGVVRPYVKALHFAYVNDISTHLSGRGLFSNPKCYLPFLRRKPRLGLHLRRTAKPMTTDMVVWNLKQRELAVYGTDKQESARCPPRGPTDLIVWRLEDRELAVIGGGVNDSSLACEDGHFVDDGWEDYGDGCGMSDALWFALGVGGGVAGGACCVLATGHGGDKASVFVGGIVAGHASADEDAILDAMDLSGTTLNDSLIKEKDDSVVTEVTGDEDTSNIILPPVAEPIRTKKKYKVSCVVENKTSPLETLLTYLALVGIYEVDIANYLASLEEDYLLDGPTPLCRFISQVDPGPEHIHVSLGPNALIKKEFLPPIPANIFDIVPNSTVDVQSMLKKTCVTQNCGVECKVQTCPQCQICVSLSDEAHRWSRLSHFDRVDLVVDITIEVLTPPVVQASWLLVYGVPIFILVCLVLECLFPPFIKSIHVALICWAYADEWWYEIVFWIFVLFWIDEWVDLIGNPYRIGREDELPNYKVVEYQLDPVAPPSDTKPVQHAPSAH